MRKVARFGVATCSVAVLAAVHVAQETSTPPIEITKTDITKIDKLRSVNLTLFGIALGDRTDTAQERVRAAGFRPDTVASRQVGGRFIRVFDSSEKEIFGITDEGGTVAGLTLRNDLAPQLPGESSKLFHASMMEPESTLRLRLLGREDSRTVEHPRGTSITEINISYDKEGIRLTQSFVEGMGDLPPVFHLVMPAKPR